MPDEAAATYKELFDTNPDNEWNADFGDEDSTVEGSGAAAGEGGSYLGALDGEGTRALIDGDGFDSGDIDDWRTRCRLPQVHSS